MIYFLLSLFQTYFFKVTRKLILQHLVSKRYVQHVDSWILVENYRYHSLMIQTFVYKAIEKFTTKLYQSIVFIEDFTRVFKYYK